MMATGFRKVEQGHRFRTTVLIGRDDDPGHIPAGSEVTAREFVDVDDHPLPGVEHVVLEYPRKIAYLDDDGEPRSMIQPQAFSLTEDQFRSWLEPID